MVTTSGNLFHIDFGHFLGNKKFIMVTMEIGWEHRVTFHIHGYNMGIRGERIMRLLLYFMYTAITGTKGEGMIRLLFISCTWLQQGN